MPGAANGRYPIPGQQPANADGDYSAHNARNVQSLQFGGAPRPPIGYGNDWPHAEGQQDVRSND